MNEEMEHVMTFANTERGRKHATNCVVSLLGEYVRGKVAVEVDGEDIIVTTSKIREPKK